jgi:hypothetical protein
MGRRFCFIVFLAQLSLCARLARAATPQELFEEVRARYAAQRNAVRSIKLQCHLTFVGMQRTFHMRYLRAGDRFVHREITESGDSLGAPIEIAWDGARGYRRDNIGILMKSTDKDRMSHNSWPESMVEVYAVYTFGFDTTRLDLKSEVISAKEQNKGGDREVEIEFVMPAYGHKYITTHKRSVGYRPTGTRGYNAEGKLVFELKDVEYFPVDSEGNRIWIPIHLVADAIGSNSTVRQEFVVDKDTIKVNEKVEPGAFVLSPYPFEEVYDWDTGESIKAKTPAAPFADHYTFPFADFVKHIGVKNVSEYRQYVANRFSDERKKKLDQAKQ